MAKTEAKKIVQKEATVEVSVTSIGKPKSSSEKIKIRPFVTETASIGLKYGATIPTVDYGNVRVDVFVNCPCYVEEFGKVYKQVHELTDKIMEREVDHLMGKGIEGRG